MRTPIHVPLKAVLANNRRFLRNVLHLREKRYLEIMSKVGSSSAFESNYRSHPENGSFTGWSSANPTRGWCAQMTRFLKDYELIPEGYVACYDKKGHYYFINDEDKVIDLTIYQSNCSDPEHLICYPCYKARFNPVKARSTKDAMKLNGIFQRYYRK